MSSSDGRNPSRNRHELPNKALHLTGRCAACR